MNMQHRSRQGAQSEVRSEGGALPQLGPWLCWAVVFADIGTSIYYVPGILYGTVNKLAGQYQLPEKRKYAMLVITNVRV